MRFRENSRSASAVATFLPRMSCATRFSFCGLTRIMRWTALASLSARERGRTDFPMSHSPRLSSLGFLVAGVAVVGARRRELAEFVAHHLLRHVDGNMLVAVVDAEGEAHELGQHRRAPAPDLDHLRAARVARGVRLLEQIAVDERTLL